MSLVIPPFSSLKEAQYPKNDASYNALSADAGSHLLRRRKCRINTAPTQPLPTNPILHSSIARDRCCEYDANAAIDRDIQLIKKELSKETPRGWANGENIYREGAYTKPVAIIKLKEPLSETIPKGSEVVGLTEKNSTLVSGTLYKEATENEIILQIQYDISEVQENYVNCQVGGNPSPKVDGCFASVGSVSINNQDYLYEYNLLEGNVNYRSVSDFSTTARSRMWECSHCPFEDFERFFKYYGEFNYADRIITHAFRGEKTTLKNGNMDFGYYSDYGLSEFIHKAMAYISVFMYTIRQMEQAIADCDKGEFLEGIHFWDEAVALYAGSLSQVEGSNGDLMFHQAELRCKEFVTCGENSDSREGLSYVNSQVFMNFQQGQASILHDKCHFATKNKERIVTLMIIPLIQGALRYAHIVAHEDSFFEKHGAEGTLFALSVLPFVHDCSPEDAEIIYENLKSKDTADVDFTAVKKAFENTYQCLNIQCSDVGGIWDSATGDYKADAFPCVSEEDNSLVILIGSGCGALIVFSVIGLWILRRRKRRAMAATHISSGDAVFRDSPSEVEFQQTRKFLDKPRSSCGIYEMNLNQHRELA
eukprot:scaffold834_cov123-Cylindrotheca_fusiformis.AAC.35